MTCRGLALFLVMLAVGCSSGGKSSGGTGGSGGSGGGSGGTGTGGSAGSGGSSGSGGSAAGGGSAGADAGHDAASDAPSTNCPADMVALPDGSACIDRYEASRPDATDTDPGTTDGAAQSVAGKIPWTNVSQDAAAQACTAAGKRLCTWSEWVAACQGAAKSAYPYGDTADEQSCLTSGATWSGPKPAPTGAFAKCQGGVQGLFDMGGNVSEWLSTNQNSACGTACYVIAGGNYSTPAVGAKCSQGPYAYGPNTKTGYNGFRCCADP